jgi:ABC-type antimicrobial peptide transport system permease subunit
MRLFDLIKLSLRMFKARTMRTLLTILGMSIGIAAILFLVSLGYGLQKTILERITTSDSLVTLDVTSAGTEAPPLDQAVLDNIRNLEGVVEISPSVQLPAQGKLDSITLDLKAIGTTPAFFRLSGTKVTHGTLLDTTHPEGVIITAAIANVFGKTPEEIVGQEFQLNVFQQQNDFDQDNAPPKNASEEKMTRSYIITGVIEGDENLAYVQLDTLDKTFFSYYNEVKVKSKSTEIMNGVREQIVAKGLVASSLSETIDQVNKVFRVVQFVLMLFGIIALVVSAIGMFNTMTIALLERTEEIGIMKSIGASRGSISLMFIVEASIMGFLGGVGGVAVGYGGGQVFNVLINLVAQRFGGESMDLFYSPLWFVGLIILFGSFVGFLTGLFPARKASHIDPLEALRYK